MVNVAEPQRTPRSTSTLVVAASNAHPRSIAQAHYRCDGVDDEKTIQAAAAALPSGVGRLVYTEGTFNIADNGVTNGTPFNMVNGLHHVGMGQGATFFQFNASRGINADRYMFRAKGATDDVIQNWSIGNMTIKCQDAQDHGIGIIGASRWKLYNLNIEHTGNETSTDEGIQTAGGDAGLSEGIIDNVFITLFDIGMEHRAGSNHCKNIKHYNVVCDANLTKGIQVLRTSGGNAPVDMDFYGCWGNNSSASGADGWNLDGCQDIHIHGGGAAGNAGDGVNFGSSNNDPLRCTVLGMSLRENGASGLVLRGTDHRIGYNNAIDNVASGFRVADSSAGPNWLSFNSAKGIGITPTNGFKENNNPVGVVYIGNSASGNTNNFALGNAPGWQFGNKGLVNGQVADPGNGNAILATQSGQVALVTGGSGQTRTLADGASQGLTLDLYLKTDGGGDCVVTVASPVNQANNTVMTFAEVGDHIRLVTIEKGSDFEWRVVANDGVALS